jgi:hypothetical protein
MAKLLNLDEMVECLSGIDAQSGALYRRILEETGTTMAAIIAERLDIESGRATFEGTAFAGTCAPFWPKHDGQECPAPLEHYDAEEWEVDAEYRDTLRQIKVSGMTSAIESGIR